MITAAAPARRRASSSAPAEGRTSDRVTSETLRPRRRRIQHVVDRRFNRARYDAEATVAAFTARLRNAVELEAIRADLVDAANRAVEPLHASVWIKP